MIKFAHKITAFIPKKMIKINLKYNYLKIIPLVIAFIAMGSLKISAQVNIADSTISLWMLQVGYKGFLPGGDMASRYGFTSTAGLTVGYKWASGYYVTAGAHSLFGGKIKEDSILRNITIEGFLIDNEGNFVAPRPSETGFIVPFSVGKIFQTGFAPNKNSGIYAEIGGQFIQHRVWFNIPRNRVPALTKEYQKGYDRLTNGVGITQSIGYRNFSNNSFYNFSIGLDFSQNFTQNRRAMDFDTGQKDTRKRIDLLFGISINWIFPIYKQADDKVHYY